MFFDRELFEETHNRLSSLNSSLEALLGHTPYRVMSTEEMDRKGSKGFEAGISIEGEGMLNPYKLHGALLERVRSLGVEVLFGFELETVRNEGNACELKLKGYDTPLQSPRTVLACNGFTEKLLPGTDIAPARGQILITGPLGNLPIEGAFHMDRGDLYFRNVGTRVLLGGGRSLEVDKEGTREQGLNQRIQEELECLLEERILPGRSYLIEDRWSGIMGFSPDKMPKLQAVDERIFLMAGFSGMGVALSFSAGERMAEQILG